MIAQNWSMYSKFLNILEKIQAHNPILSKPKQLGSHKIKNKMESISLEQADLTEKNSYCLAC